MEMYKAYLDIVSMLGGAMVDLYEICCIRQLGIQFPYPLDSFSIREEIT